MGPIPSCLTLDLSGDVQWVAVVAVGVFYVADPSLCVEYVCGDAVSVRRKPL